MYRISQLISTPVVLLALRQDILESRLPHVFFQEQQDSTPMPKLDGGTSFKCCSVDLLTAPHFACRRSPRLLSNGYYTWTEDSFLCDKDGNITLSPPQTSVLYKENLVRIFRKKKRIRRSFSNLFNLGASKSWLHGNIFGDVDSSLSEDTWLEGVRRLDMYHCNEIGGDSDRSLTDAWESEQPNAASSPNHAASLTSRQNSHDGLLQSHVMASEHFPGNILDHAKTSLWREVSFPAILLAVCFIICACARWFLGGIIASVFTCSLMITIAYTVKSLFLGLASHVKSTTYAQFSNLVCRRFYMNAMSQEREITQRCLVCLRTSTCRGVYCHTQLMERPAILMEHLLCARCCICLIYNSLHGPAKDYFIL
ncbi:transmembrane protein 71 isoform X3 [Eumetopias jubatus]|uniref:transmembrane protein 71 isoform X3 n=1 Tax=Eumetopias jubatus TaxID=34886 RepID=UPI0010160F00|nr:transmembrane protein 71 isoform X3 [Eumetopias jubatus]